MQQERRRRVATAWRTLLLVGIVSLFVFPIVWTLSMSLRPRAIMFELPPRWIFTPISEHYSVVLSNSTFIGNLINSLIIASLSTILTVLVGTPAAYSLARLRPKGRDDMMMFVLASRMAPPIALVIPFFLIYARVGLLGTHHGLVIAYLTFNLSFYVWLLSVFTREIPGDLERAALADGYSPTYVYFRVMLPLMKSSVVAVAVLVFIFAWNEFAFALILSSRASETLPLAISRFVTPSGVQYGPLAALGTIAIVPVAVLVFALHKHIVRGLSFGAVKG